MKFETLKQILTHSTDATITITSMILVIVTVLFILYWLYNRRRFHQLSHQIPASVVKNYLDSIIQNSTALKSSLFRGGGLEVSGGVPSVFPTSDLVGGNISLGGASSEELSQKIAEIASLNNRLMDRERLISELERKLADLKSNAPAGGNSEEVEILQKEVSKLRTKLTEAENNSSSQDSRGDEALNARLSEVTKERDELKERLMEYEIIEEDLANLKRLQQENEQLKKTIASLQGGSVPAATPAAAPVEEVVQAAPEPQVEEEAPEEATAPEEVEEEVAAAAPEEEVPQNEGEQKSAEELLSEFEKMLG